MSAAGRLACEYRALAATTRKELRLMRRYPAELVSLALWMVLLPLAYIAQAEAFSAGGPAPTAAFADRAGTGDVVTFLYLGWSVYLLVTVVLWGPGLALRQERERGSFEVVFASPTSRFTLLFGTAPAQLLPALVVVASAAASMRLLFGTGPDPAGLLRWLVVLLVAFPVLMALAGVFATASLSLQDAAGALQTVRGLFTLLCGVTYPLAVLPGAFRAIGAALPPTHLLDALRGAVPDGGSLGGQAGRLLLLLAESLPLGAAAMALLWVSVGHARRTGKTGRF
ncbi:ABC transporter permease [Actinomadura fibrosa]|uniref:ABC transporter permease n=1 Tax=Actinomadura fibrosa TaxID=111802 RepID=A0ABW2XIY3_9ACTN|nr:ABC transporter permease [Actinomadura fibrosa]